MSVVYQMSEDQFREMSRPKDHDPKKRWFVKDPCGIACVVLTYILVGYATLSFLTVILPPFISVWSLLNGGAFLTLMILGVISHYRAMFTEPGIVVREPISEEEVLTRHQQGEKIRYCKKCRSLKPDRAHHCSTCERCIYRMDHHCPWVNNCVGANNQKYFLLFTMYIMAMSVHGLLTVVWFFIRCASQDFTGCDALWPGPVVFVLVLLGVFEGFLFALFTCMMFFSQVHAIATDETGIESLKNEHRPSRPWYDSFTEVLGSPAGIRVAWLGPAGNQRLAILSLSLLGLLLSICTNHGHMTVM